jgi:hypothetical protein
LNIAQGVIGCLVANALRPEINHSFMQQQYLAIVLIIVGPNWPSAGGSPSNSSIEIPPPSALVSAIMRSLRLISVFKIKEQSQAKM